MENCTRCNWGLTTLQDKVNEQSILLLSLFDRTQACSCWKSGSIDLKCHLDSAAWVPLGNINAMENCARCDWGLTTLPGEGNVRFIVLRSLFDRTQGRICVWKSGSIDLKCHLDPAA